MKVLHLINNLQREGAQVVVFNLVTSTGPSFVQHIVYAREPGGPLQSALEKCGIPIYVADQYYGALATKRSLKFIDQVIEKEAVDVVHAHMTDSAILGWLAARRRELPLVTTHHGHKILPVCSLICRAVYFVCLFFAARYAQYNIAVSTSVANRVRRIPGLDKKSVRIITNGVPVPNEEHVDNRQLNELKSPSIVSVGRLVALKGQDQLVAAAAILVNASPTARRADAPCDSNATGVRSPIDIASPWYVS